MANAVVSDWPSGSANTGWPQEPSAMLMPGRVQGWPAGTQRASNAAQRLLSQAVAWWDVEQYRDGDRFLRNRGTAGELLDLRLGSSIVANSNDPLYLAPEDQGYVYLPGVAGNYLSVPDAPAVSITGDIDIRAKVNLTTWTPTVACTFVSKWNNSPQNSYMLTLLDAADGNKLRMLVSSTGSDTYSATSSVAPGFSPGTTAWVRATYATASGEVKFYTSTDDATTWTQLGTTQTTTAVAIYDGTQRVEIGSFQGQSAPLVGRVYRAQILNGINGTTALDIDCDAITSGSATSFTAVSNQTVSVSRSTSGRKSVAVPSRHKGGRPVMLLGTDDYLEIPVENGWQHGLLNFDQGQSFTVLAVVRRWATLTTHRIIWKSASGNSAPMYRLLGADATYAGRLELLDGTNTATVNTPTGTTGDVAVHTFTVDRNSQRATPYAGTPGTSVSTRTVGSVAPREASLRVGRDQGSNYADMELYAVAFWRRALSPDEITTLSNYFTGRIA